MKKCLLFLALLCSFVTFSQQLGYLKGKVVDNFGEPIFDASVILQSDFTRGAKTDFDGIYQLKLPAGNFNIICRSVGLITDTFAVSIEAGKTTILNIDLKSAIQELEEVEVKVGRFDKPLEEQTVSMEVIKPELLEAKGTRSVETALDQTPGLNILDGEPQIRGGSGFTFGVGSKVAVIVDEMPMLSGDAGRPEWGFVPVENISQIEVIKGASSVLGGSSALSGMIHIRTAYPKAKPLTKVNVYSGFYTKPSVKGAKWWSNFPLIAGANFLHSRQVKNWDVVLGANINYDHGYIGFPVQDSLVENHAPDTISNFNESQMAMKRARINFNLRHRSKKFKGLTYGINGNFMLAQSNMAFAWLNDSSGLYQAYPGAVFLQEQFIFNVDPFIKLITQTVGEHSFRMRVLHSDNQMTANQDNRATTYYGNYMFKKRFKSLKNLDMISGLTGTYTRSYAELYAGAGSPYNNLTNLSAYLEVEKKFGKVLNVSVGGRLEYFDLNGVDSLQKVAPIFRAGASLKLHQATFLRGSFGQGYRYPTITERFINTGVGNFGVFANPGLKPEKSWNAELGIKQGLKFGKIYGFIDLAVFAQEYKNTIEYLFGFWGDPSVNPVFGFKFLNTGSSRVLGVDVSFTGKAKIGKKSEIKFMLGYNYISPKTLNPDYVYAVDKIGRKYSYNNTSLDSSSRLLKYRFVHNLKADIEFSLFKKLDIGFSVKYFSKIENMDGVISEFEDATSGPFVQTIRYMDYFEAHRFGNVIVDARIAYSINQSHKIALIGSNILNRSYSLRPLKIEAPRSIMLQYTLKLNKNV